MKNDVMIRKTLFIALMLFSLMTLSAQSKKEDAKLLLSLMNVEKIIDAQLGNMSSMLKQQIMNDFKGDTEKAQNYIDFLMRETAVMSKELVNKEMVSIYEEHFTAQEIKDLVNFYKSPTGQKIIQKTPLIQQELLEIMKDKYLPKFQRKLIEKIKKMNND